MNRHLLFTASDRPCLTIWLFLLCLIAFPVNTLFAADTTMYVPLFPGANLVSMPLDLSDSRTSAVITDPPGILASPFFRYDGGYVPTDSLKPGYGYLVESNDTGKIIFIGTKRSHLDIALKPGLNLIGSISSPVLNSNIAYSTDGLVDSLFYSLYPCSHQFSKTTTILPGVGYWIRAKTGGTLTLDAGSCGGQNPPVFDRSVMPNPNTVILMKTGDYVTHHASVSKPGPGLPTLTAAVPPPWHLDFTPSVPVTGNPAYSDWSGTATIDDSGSHLLRFFATDSCGLWAEYSSPLFVESPRNFLIPLNFTDTTGISTTIYWGLTPTATIGLDTNLGELALPPQLNDLRIGHHYIDIRPFTSTTQKDTFSISAMVIPGTISWPELSQYYSGAVLLLTWDGNGNPVTIDMKTTHSCFLPDYDHGGTSRIITSNPRINEVFLKSPENGVKSLPLNPILFWYQDPGTNSYDVQVAVSADMSGIILDSSSITDTSLQIHSLTPATWYYWRVRPVDKTGPGPWSTIFKFNTYDTSKTAAVFGIVVSTPDTSLNPLMNLPWKMYFGSNVRATNGFDSLSPTVKELRMPPLPPGLSAGWWTPENGLMMRYDFRGMPADPAQPDTFRLRARCDDIDTGYLFLQWPSHDYLAARCDSMFLEYNDVFFGPTKVNMFFERGLAANWNSSGYGGFLQFTIYSYGARRVDTIDAEPFIDTSGRWVQYHEGWNIISTSSTALEFPTAITNAPAYGYQPGSGYAPVVAPIGGQGYWSRFAGQFMVPFPCAGNDTSIDVSAGWNLIGSECMPVEVVSITSDPPGIQTSAFFGYNKGYFDANTILPGAGYWVKVGQAGKLILSASGARVAARIRIVRGNELPPPPPDQAVVKNRVPTVYALDQNYPNPFNPTTTIRYQLPFDSRVKLSVYNLLGQVVRTLIDGTEGAGYKQVGLDGAALSSGIYFYRLDATVAADPSKNFTNIKKMVLVK